MKLKLLCLHTFIQKKEKEENDKDEEEVEKRTVKRTWDRQQKIRALVSIPAHIYRVDVKEPIPSRSPSFQAAPLPEPLQVRMPGKQTSLPTEGTA